MELRTCTLLYSNYSPKSNELLQNLRNCPVNLEAMVGLSFLCVDNEKIRKKIVKSKNIQINSVPCLLILYNTGDVEKFEGTRVFEWIDDIVRHNLPPQQPPQQPPPPVQQQPMQQQPMQQQPMQQQPMQQQPMQQQPMQQQPMQQPMQQQPMQQPMQQQYPMQQQPMQQQPMQQQYPMQQEFEESYSGRRGGSEGPPSRRRKKKVHLEEYSDEEEEYRPTAKPRGKGRPKMREELSKIENLDSDESDPDYVKKPPAGVRNGAGNYDLTDDFGKTEEVNRDMSSKMKPSSDKGTQGSNLMAMAQQMQKEREM